MTALLSRISERDRMLAELYARQCRGRYRSLVASDAKAFIAARGWTLDPAHVYTDDGVSGALFANRAEFQRMMRDAEAGAFNAVVFYDLVSPRPTTREVCRVDGV